MYKCLQPDLGKRILCIDFYCFLPCCLSFGPWFQFMKTDLSLDSTDHGFVLNANLVACLLWTHASCWGHYSGAQGQAPPVPLEYSGVTQTAACSPGTSSNQVSGTGGVKLLVGEGQRTASGRGESERAPWRSIRHATRRQPIAAHHTPRLRLLVVSHLCKCCSFSCKSLFPSYSLSFSKSCLLSPPQRWDPGPRGPWTWPEVCYACPGPDRAHGEL